MLKLSDSERNLMGMLIAEARRCIATPLDDPYTEKMEKKEDFLFGSQQLIRIYLEQMLIYMIRRNSSPPMTVPVSQFLFPFKDCLCQTADPRKPDELHTDFGISGILFHPLLFQTV